MLSSRLNLGSRVSGCVQARGCTPLFGSTQPASALPPPGCPAPAQGCRGESLSGSTRRAAADQSANRAAGLRQGGWKWCRYVTSMVAAIFCIVALTGFASAGPSSRPSANAYSAGPSASAFYEAAVRGDAAAQAKLAEQYVKSSQKDAFQWCWRAARQGHAGAQLQLADMFANGQGVPKHLVTAYFWAHLAQSNAVGDEMTAKADRMIVRLADQMSPAEIREALHRAEDWKPQPEAKPTERLDAKSGAGGFSLATDNSQGERRIGPGREGRR